MKLFEELREIYSLKHIAKKLNLATGTVQRWIELNNIPHHYTFDLLRILDKNIDYSSYKSSEKDSELIKIAAKDRTVERVAIPCTKCNRKYQYQIEFCGWSLLCDGQRFSLGKGSKGLRRYGE
jgi:glutamine cyclotransferase